MRGIKKRFYTEDLENLSEDVVFEAIDRLLADESQVFCRCPICLQDLAAIVLNRVPQLYCCSLLEKNSPNEELARRLARVRELVDLELPAALELVRASNNH